MQSPSWREISHAVLRLSELEVRESSHPPEELDLELLIQRVASLDDVSILILGETGTGKTCLARRIHASGRRSSGPLVEVNCASIPQSLIESELFGHVKGAFTGATETRLGKIRAAHGGILFLDEVGELSLELQARLLKAIEDRTVTPVGSERPIRVDLRLIAASNRDLGAMVLGGAFRLDLFERLNQVSFRVPPLRERKGSIFPLAADCIERWNSEHGEVKRLSEAALESLSLYDWPGNIRELQNAVTSACVRCPGDEILAEHLPPRFAGAPSSPPCSGESGPYLPPNGVDLRGILFEIEWSYFRSALRQCGGNAAEASRLLGLDGHAFRKALRERFALKVEDLVARAMIPPDSPVKP